jgi:hypothetical protein
LCDLVTSTVRNLSIPSASDLCACLPKHATVFAKWNWQHSCTHDTL